MTKHVKSLAVLLFIILPASSGTEFGCVPPAKRKEVELFGYGLRSYNINTYTKGKFPVGYVIEYNCAENYTRFIPQARIQRLICDSRPGWSGLDHYLSFACKKCKSSCDEGDRAKPIFGKQTSIRNWPWHVAIYARRNKDSEFRYICGGSLIQPLRYGAYFVLTAGHCVATSRDEPRNIENIFVVFGANFSRLEDNSRDIKVRYFNVSRIILHDSYQTKDYQADIALLYITDFKRGYWNEPISLSFIKKAPSIGSIGKLAGFGRFDKNNPNISDTLREIQIPITDQINCYKWRSNKLLLQEICAGTEGNENVCSGDSGGGLIVVGSFDPENFETLPIYIQGIISHSRKAFNETLPECDTFSVFTNVYFYLDWIYEVARTYRSYQDLEKQDKNLDSETSFSKKYDIECPKKFLLYIILSFLFFLTIGGNIILVILWLKQKKMNMTLQNQ